MYFIIILEFSVLLVQVFLQLCCPVLTEARHSPEHDIHQLRQTASLFLSDILQDKHNVMQSKLVFSSCNNVLSWLLVLNSLQFYWIVQSLVLNERFSVILKVAVQLLVVANGCGISLKNKVRRILTKETTGYFCCYDTIWLWNRLHGLLMQLWKLLPHFTKSFYAPIFCFSVNGLLAGWDI